jgi:hypothetical protein
MTTKQNTTERIVRNGFEPNSEQTKRALEHIAHMACALQSLCFEIEKGE